MPPPATPRRWGRLALAVGAVVVGLGVALAVLWNLVDRNAHPEPSSSGIPGLEIVYPRDGAIVHSAHIEVRGTAPAGAEIVLTRLSAPDSRATAEGDGEWFMNVELEVGVNDLVFTIGSDNETEQQLRITYEPIAEPEPTPTPAPATTATANMIELRANHTATLLPNGQVLVAGGDGGARSLDSAELYDPDTESWTATGKMVMARYSHTATLLFAGTVLVVGGNGLSGGSFGPLASAEVFDPSTGTWAATGPLAESRSGHTATLLPDGRVLVTGGTVGGGGLASAELYDPRSGTWAVTESMSAVRYGHTATLLPDGRVLVTGGFGPIGLVSAELYSPGSGTWAVTGNMAQGRYGHTATLLPDGTVLVAGGAGSTQSFAASAELYDPIGGSWAATGNLVTPRYAHTATLLANGSIFAAGGGDDSGGGYRDSAELYDPGSGSWDAIGRMIEGRISHTATLLGDGRVLVTGGFTSDFIVDTAELYDPNSGT